MIQFQATEAYARSLDADDLLTSYREKFYIPKDRNGTDCIYFCGNSLGLQPKSTRAYIEQELQDWETRGVEGHFQAKHPWMPYHEFVAEQTARLVGAKPVEVVAMNSLTVNLHLMLASFYRPTASRYKIAIEANAFPSDQYAIKSQLQFHKFDPDDALITFHPRVGESTICHEEIESLIAKRGEEIALILLGGVNYYTGQAFDMARITRAGHRMGCMVGFDLAHAVGNLALKLHDSDADFAVWCSYKYLNAGPGSIAGCFVHERHAHNLDLPRFAGWWGHDKNTRFQMGSNFQPIPGAEGWQLSNPPIFPLAALRASMDIFDKAGMEMIRTKSIKLTGYLEYLLDRIRGKKLSIITPRNTEERGAQLSLRVGQNGKKLFEALHSHGVICDWREPDAIRVAPAPLYNTFSDVYRFAKILQEKTGI